MSIIQNVSTLKIGWLDAGCLKIAVFFITLFFAKIWSPLLGQDWYWYVAGGVIFAIRPFWTTFRWVFKS